jgi:Type II secretion system (T2SS), protein G
MVCLLPIFSAVKGRATAERIEELLSAISPPALDEASETEVDAGTRWPLTLVALTALVLVIVGWTLVDSPVEQDPIMVRSRIERDLHTLAKLVEGYHAEAHRYPDAATWRLSAQRGDGRFLDPWRHPYAYRLGPASFSIGTYGADQRRGGSGLDMDVELSFPRTLLDGERPVTSPSDEESTP